ncbi:MAG: hypothetical protein HQK83_17760 [Fibrobacteria bacterium]|nr:hypothetical protein [Fibrobacteria bacterium]
MEYKNNRHENLIITIWLCVSIILVFLVSGCTSWSSGRKPERNQVIPQSQEISPPLNQQKALKGKKTPQKEIIITSVEVFSSDSLMCREKARIMAGDKMLFATREYLQALIEECIHNKMDPDDLDKVRRVVYHTELLTVQNAMIMPAPLQKQGSGYRCSTELSTKKENIGKLLMEQIEKDKIVYDLIRSLSALQAIILVKPVPSSR